MHRYNKATELLEQALNVRPCSIAVPDSIDTYHVNGSRTADIPLVDTVSHAVSPDAWRAQVAIWPSCPRKYTSL